MCCMWNNGNFKICLLKIIYKTMCVLGHISIVHVMFLDLSFLLGPFAVLFCQMIFAMLPKKRETQTLCHILQRFSEKNECSQEASYVCNNVFYLMSHFSVKICHLVSLCCHLDTLGDKSSYLYSR